MSEVEARQALERRLISLEEKNGRLTTALTTARTELIRLQGELADVSRPPQTLATFVRAFPASRQIEVVTGGKHMRVAVTPKLDVTDLSYGQWVRLDDTMIAVAADDFPDRSCPSWSWSVPTVCSLRRKAARRPCWSWQALYATETCVRATPSLWMPARVSRSSASCARTSSSC